MAPNIGFSALLLALILSSFQPLYSFLCLKTNNPKQLGLISKYCSIAIFALCSIAFLMLVYSYVISDFSVKNVYLNSHELKPLIYKISGTWGNHEGSILLLATILSAYSVAFNLLSKITISNKIIVLSIQSLIICGILAFIIFTSNPFLPIFPTPISGLGLNPILQDIGLAMHPPMLYSGYIGFSLIFSLTICALLKQEVNRNFAKSLKPWLLFSWSLLTLGIGLGSWWAYRELGWGGYWFWDPVENVSLMPWLCATALLHCIVVLEKSENFKIWTCFLSILSFVLCLLGIFLVRSGILTSVHSFANDPERGIFILFLLLIIGGGGFLVFFFKSLKIKSTNKDFDLSSQIGFILINNFFFSLALFVVILGTLYPLILQFFDISISVGAPYYQKMLSPLAIMILFLMIFVPDLKVQKRFSVNRENIKKWVIIMILTLFCFSFLIFIDFKLKLIPLISIFVALLALLSSILHKKINSKYYSMMLGHVGMSIIIIAISAGSLFSSTREINMKIGDEVQISNHKIKFENTQNIAAKNYIARVGIFKIDDNVILKPQSRYYPVSNQNTTEAAIKNSLLYDLYIVLGDRDEKSGYFAVRIYYKSLMSFLWLGCFMVFLSGIIFIFFRKIR